MKLRTSVYISIILAIVYICMALFTPIDPVVIDKYDISESKIRFLNLTITIPIVIIWFVAIYGYVRFKNYAEIVRDSKEGPAYSQLATGLMILAFTLPINGVISGAFKIITLNNPGFMPTAEIIKNYVGLALALAAFYLIAQSARKLTSAFKIKTMSSKRESEYAAIALIAFSCLYTWLVLYRPLVGGSEDNIYFLPNWLILVSLIIPYMYAWRAGVQGAYHLYWYHQHIRGYVYKSAFKYLAWGIGSVVVVSILIQSITAISEQFNRLDLAPLLIIIYALLVMYAVGFGLVAKGARKLTKIEEV